MVVGILIMILLMPAFEIRVGTWGKPHGVDQGGLKMLHDVAVSQGNATRSFEVALAVGTGTGTGTAGGGG